MGPYCCAEQHGNFACWGVKSMHLSRLRFSGVPSRSLALVVAMVVGVATLVMTATPVAAFGRVVGQGSILCSLHGNVSFANGLTAADEGSDTTQLRASLSQCSTTPSLDAATDFTAPLRGVFASSPFDCTTLTTTGVPLTGNASWHALVYVDRQGHFFYRNEPVAASHIVDGVSNGSSFPGDATISFNIPPALASGCASRQGARNLVVSGTVTLGPTCGPGSEPITMYALDQGPLCGGIYSPGAITTGPDGAMWFTNSGHFVSNQPKADASIGRITTSGQITEFPLPLGPDSLSGERTPVDITAGSDGALWFTLANSAEGIGRITTSGQISFYPLPSQDNTGSIVVGPDGALWFTDTHNSGSSASTTALGAIGRITTSGQVTLYPVTQDYPGGLVVGPDGALWFTCHHSIGRITTAGQLTLYPQPTNDWLGGIAISPEGDSLWFTVSGPGSSTADPIGRITTSGQTTFSASSSPYSPGGLSAAPDGGFWFGTWGPPGSHVTSVIGRMTASGMVTNTYTAPGLYDANGLVLGPDGALWFTDSVNDTVGRIVIP